MSITANNATSYQWLKNGVPVSNNNVISGATTATITLTNATIADTGYYQVNAINECYSATSNSAYLNVDSSSKISYTSPNYFDLNTTIAALKPTGLAVKSKVFAGNGAGYLDASDPLTAKFSAPDKMAMDPDGNIYVSELALYTGYPLYQYAYRIRKISTTGVVTTLAGSTTTGALDGNGTSATFDMIYGMATDASGNLFVTSSNKIRKITPSGIVTTFAGNGNSADVDGTGTGASFNGPQGIFIDKRSGIIYVTEFPGNTIRKITPSGVVTTLAGKGGFISSRIIW
jgi:sugar lactone lactonase YvrE